MIVDYLKKCDSKTAYLVMGMYGDRILRCIFLQVTKLTKLDETKFVIMLNIIDDVVFQINNTEYLLFKRKVIK